MRKYLTRVSIVAAMLAAALLPPWLAWKEAGNQALESESRLTQSYAQDVLHRSDATTGQAAARLRELNESGLPPCSPASLEMMREIDLATSYLQAVGYVRNGTIVCSSLGTHPIPLGGGAYDTSRGYRIYPHVPLAGAAASPLLAIEQHGYAVVIHRDLPIDTSVMEPDVSLGLFHLEHKETISRHGFIDPAWIAQLGKLEIATGINGAYLVSIVRSRQALVAAIAAMPAYHVAERAGIIAWRLVPPALLVGLVMAGLVLLAWRRQTSMDTGLRQGLRRNEFYLLYQPIVDLDSGAVIGAEALLRWRRPDGEEVSPELFIPVAERSSVMPALTDRVMNLIARDVGACLSNRPGFHIAINLSAGDIQSPAIVRRIEDLIAHCGARPSNFILEITERSVLDLDATRMVLQALRERDIEVAIDDFGTGYSSLAYIESLHVDYLKIDRTFIEAIGTGAPTSQVVGHIIDMARSMRLRVIAEGIESAAQAAFLRDRHVQFAQGWSFGRPMPFADVLRHAREREHAVQINPAPYPARS